MRAAVFIYLLLQAACTGPRQEKITSRSNDTLVAQEMDASKLAGYYEYMNDGGKWGYEMELNMNGNILFSFESDTEWTDYSGTWKVRQDTLFATYTRQMSTLSSSTDWGYSEEPIGPVDAIDTFIRVKGQLVFLNRPFADPFILTDDTLVHWNRLESEYYFSQADQLLKELNALVKNGDPVHGNSRIPDQDSAFRFISKRNELENLEIGFHWEKGKYVLSAYDPQKLLSELNGLVSAAGDSDHRPEGMESTGESIVMFERMMETLRAYGIRVRWSEGRNEYVFK